MTITLSNRIEKITILVSATSFLIFVVDNKNASKTCWAGWSHAWVL